MLTTASLRRIACTMCGATTEHDYRTIEMYDVELWQEQKNKGLEDKKTPFKVRLSLCDECYVSEPVANRNTYDEPFANGVITHWGVTLTCANPK